MHSLRNHLNSQPYKTIDITLGRTITVDVCLVCQEKKEKYWLFTRMHYGSIKFHCLKIFINQVMNIAVVLTYLNNTSTRKYKDCNTRSHDHYHIRTRTVSLPGKEHRQNKCIPTQVWLVSFYTYENPYKSVISLSTLHKIRDSKSSPSKTSRFTMSNLP